jgi:hypothetical protein
MVMGGFLMGVALDAFLAPLLSGFGFGTGSISSSSAAGSYPTLQSVFYSSAPVSA